MRILRNAFDHDYYIAIKNNYDGTGTFHKYFNRDATDKIPIIKTDAVEFIFPWSQMRF